MTDAEDAERRRKQRQALQVAPTGATIQPVYLERTSEVVAVNRSDLEDLLRVDGVERALTGFGQFFFAGALWLFFEKWLAPTFVWDALAGFCLASLVFGAILVGAGLALARIKRTKIDRLFRGSPQTR